MEINKRLAQPAREVHVGDMLKIGAEGGDFQVEVLILGDARGPAPRSQW